jgi:glycosyltransferase involved in cell wall biosynthesis
LNALDAQQAEEEQKDRQPQESPVRVTLVGPVYPYRGGIAHYTTMLDAALRAEGHDVQLISFSRQYPRWLFPGKSDRDPSQKPLAAPAAHYWIDSLNPFSWVATFARMRRFRPQLIVLQWWTTFWAPVWLTLLGLNALLLRAPVVFVCHQVLPHEVRPLDRWLVHRTLAFGSRFVVQSAAARQQLEMLLGVVSVTVVPHPAYTMFGAHRVERSTALATLDLVGHHPVLLFFGLIRPYKRLVLLLQAMPAVLQRFPTAILAVVGEFWEDQTPYRTVIAQLGLEAHVRIDARYVPDEEVGVYFSAADALVAPYAGDGGSGAAQTATGFGIPLLSLDRADMAADDAGAASRQLAQIIIDHFSNPTAATPDTRSAAGWSDLARAVVGERAHTRE